MRLPLLLCLLPLLLGAQSDFLRDPDIVWAAEIEQDWMIDVPCQGDEWEEGITTLKLLCPEQNSRYQTTPFLSELVFRAIEGGKLPVYQDPQCTMPADPLPVYPGNDTVITFNPVTYQEKVMVVRRIPNPAYDFKAWRLRQILAYHRKSATWSTTAEAIAPLVLARNKHGDSVGMRPLYWFRPGNKRQKISSGQIVWAIRTENRPQKHRVSPHPSNPVKITDGYRNPVTHLFQVLGRNMKTPFYDSWNEKLLSPAERKAILARTDTIVTYDPETYEEKTAVVQNEISTDNVDMLRLVQTWYWDERRHRLSICLDAVAPSIKVFGFDGGYRYSKLLFFRRARR